MKVGRQWGKNWREGLDGLDHSIICMYESLKDRKSRLTPSEAPSVCNRARSLCATTQTRTWGSGSVQTDPVSCTNRDEAMGLWVTLSGLHAGAFSALLRRATTYKHQNKLQEAREDLQTVLRVEPHNDVAKVSLENV